MLASERAFALSQKALAVNMWEKGEGRSYSQGRVTSVGEVYGEWEDLFRVQYTD